MTPSKTPRKIAYIVGGLPFGGVENWLLDLSLNLRNDPDITPYVINVSGTGASCPRTRSMTSRSSPSETAIRPSTPTGWTRC
nr:hypothetical protein [Salidesulfovibrio brasiliensis]